MTQLKPTERLAAITALKKQTAKADKEVRAEVSALFGENPDIDRLTLKLKGQKVGTASRKNLKADYEIYDDEEFGEFALSYGFAYLKDTIKPECLYEATKLVKAHMPEAVITEIVPSASWKDYMNHIGETVVYFDSGEVVPGVRWVPEQQTSDFIVRGCEWDTVTPLLGDGLGTLFLEEGRDE